MNNLIHHARMTGMIYANIISAPVLLHQSASENAEDMMQWIKVFLYVQNFMSANRMN